MTQATTYVKFEVHLPNELLAKVNEAGKELTLKILYKLVIADYRRHLARLVPNYPDFPHLGRSGYTKKSVFLESEDATWLREVADAYNHHKSTVLHAAFRHYFDRNHG
jgi:hypothetical protein